MESYDTQLPIFASLVPGSSPASYAIPIHIGYAESYYTNQCVDLRKLDIRLAVEVASASNAAPPVTSSGALRTVNPFAARFILIAYDARLVGHITIDKILDLSVISDPRFAFRMLKPTLGIQIVCDADLPYHSTDVTIMGVRTNAPAPPDDLYDTARTTTYLSELHIDCSMVSNMASSTALALIGFFIISPLPVSFKDCFISGRAFTRSRYVIQDVSLYSNQDVPHMRVFKKTLDHKK